ncbi:DNA-binding protein [Chromobacterium violaceum]|uniref:helix-turn-helix domain-containing protein n=1 Tax=Chromobacterium violaceum TaxID=536 RepID=UPI0009DB3FCF|nr:helix-turn-helix domain-containing protein [Chromobacterium violaceum]OQS10867.1 DNA-binding protein [Chromobacterium violaceum]OQS30042.1 DNA-binding protein [Chromobacterium violaceum]
MNVITKLGLPTQGEVALARESSRQLSQFLTQHQDAQAILLQDEAGTHETVKVPTTVFRLLIDILAEMAQGNAVSLIPIHAELTTQEAADLLNISRPHLVKLLDEQTIPFHKVGTHRRVRYQDVAGYKQRQQQKRLETLEELAAQAQELDMGY